MKVLPLVAAVIVLAELVGAIIFAAHGSLLAVLLAAGAGAMAVIAWRLARRAWGEPPAAPSYVQREQHFF